MRKPIIAGNWKLNKTIAQAQELIKGLKQQLYNEQLVEIVVCPAYTSLAAVAALIQGTNIQLGAQDVYWVDTGAFTGEVSCPMLKEIGCQFVIIGHSERRAYFGETNLTVNRKIKAAIIHDITPIVCVGERLEEREAQKTFSVIKDHVFGAFEGITAQDAQKTIIAYEPVWAIGTGKTATPQQAQEAHSFIRNLLKQLYNEEIAQNLRIQYGGSVKPDNIAILMSQPDVDGALVGGASLELASFSQIVKGAG